MNVTEMLNNIYVFLLRLKIQIKCLSKEEFNELLKDRELGYTQKIYLCYFRYM